MRSKDETHTGGLRDTFLTTHWSLIEDIQQHQDEDRSLIGLLLERYWKPVYCYLRRKGYRNEDAKDLTQAFFHEVVLNRHLVERADRTKGRFRSFLLNALNRFLIDQKRKDGARKHIPEAKLVRLDIAHLPELPQTMTQRSAEDCFAYAWKSELLDRTLREVQTHCEQHGLERHWCLFRDKVLEPALSDGASEPMKLISARYGIESESVAFNMLLTVKRYFKVTLRKNVRTTVLADEYVDEEWHEILGLLGERGRKRLGLYVG